MANRWWVSGGNGVWNSTTNWSTVSGGPRGASAPTSLTGDFVYFDANSGTGVSALAATITVVGLDCTGFRGTLSIPTATISLIVAGDVTLSATATYTGAGIFTISIPDATTRTLTTNNAILQYPLVRFNGVTQATSIVTLVGALNVTSTTSTPTFRATSCTVNLNGYVITCGVLAATLGATFAYGSSGTSAIIIPTGGLANNTQVVNFNAPATTNSTFSGAQRPVIRLTYNGNVGSRLVLDQSGAFDYVWSGADISNSLSLSCINLDLSNFTGSILMATAMSISGDLTLNTATQWIASTLTLTFNGTGTQNINTRNVVPLNCPVTFSGTGTYVLQANLSLGLSARTTTLTSGTLNLNGKNLFVYNFASSGTTARGITFGGGKIYVAGTTSAWIATVGTNLTITGQGSIELTSDVSTTRVFDGGSVAYNGVTIIISGLTTGLGNTTSFKGSNFFYSMINTVSPHTIWFSPNTTTIFTDDFQLNGSSGKNIIITMQTPAPPQTSAPNFAKPSGTVVCNYATISWNNASYTGSPATSAFTSVWQIGTGSSTANVTGWGRSAGTADFISFFYP